MNKSTIPSVSVLVLLTVAIYSPGALSAQGAHFDPNGTMPSTYTIELRNGLSATLPFDDKRDFEEAKKGFLI